MISLEVILIQIIIYQAVEFVIQVFPVSMLVIKLFSLDIKMILKNLLKVPIVLITNWDIEN